MADSEIVAAIKNGTFAEWRAKNPDRPIDLFEADLTECAMPSDLAGANLEKAILSRADLRNANFADASLKGVDLINANLEKADFRRANLRYANLTGANLEGADLEDAVLEKANLEGANLYFATLTNTNLSHANLRRARLVVAEFNKTICRHARFEGATFFEPPFGFTEFDHVDFRQADLRGTDLQNAKYDLTSCKLQRARFPAGALDEKSELLLRIANGNLSDLQGKDLTSFNLAELTLDSVDLRNAQLKGACLEGTSLLGAKIVGVGVEGVQVDDETKMDNEFRILIELVNPGRLQSHLTKALRPNEKLKYRIIGDLKHSDLRGMDLNSCDLSGRDLEGAVLAEVSAREANFSGANLRFADLRIADLSKATFYKCNLEEANLDNAKLTSANLNLAVLTRAKFRDTEMHGLIRQNRRISQILFSWFAGCFHLMALPLLAWSLTVPGGDADSERESRFGCFAWSIILISPAWLLIMLLGAILTLMLAGAAWILELLWPRSDCLTFDLCNVRGTQFDPGMPDAWSVLRRIYTGPKMAFIVMFTVTAFIPYFLKAMFWTSVAKVEQRAIPVAANTIRELSHEMNRMGDANSRSLAQKGLALADSLDSLAFNDNGRKILLMAKRVSQFLLDIEEYVERIRRDLANESKNLERISYMESMERRLEQAKSISRLALPSKDVKLVERPVWQILIGAETNWSDCILPVLLLSYNIARAILTYQSGILRDEEERCQVTPALSDYQWLWHVHRLASVLFVFSITSGLIQIASFMNTSVIIPAPA